MSPAMYDLLEEKYGYTFADALSLPDEKFEKLIIEIAVDEALSDGEKMERISDMLTELCKQWNDACKKHAGAGKQRK